MNFSYKTIKKYSPVFMKLTAQQKKKANNILKI